MPHCILYFWGHKKHPRLQDRPLLVIHIGGSTLQQQFGIVAPHCCSIYSTKWDDRIYFLVLLIDYGILIHFRSSVHYSEVQQHTPNRSLLHRRMNMTSRDTFLWVTQTSILAFPTESKVSFKEEMTMEEMFSGWCSPANFLRLSVLTLGQAGLSMNLQMHDNICLLH